MFVINPAPFLHVDIVQTFDSFEGKRSEFDLETLLSKSLRPIF